MADNRILPVGGGAQSPDRQLRAIFTRDARGIADDGFCAAVLQRIRRRRRIRAWVIGAAALAGLGLAWEPLKLGFAALAKWGPQYTTGLQSIEWTSFTTLVGAGLVFLLIPLLTRIFEA